MLSSVVWVNLSATHLSRYNIGIHSSLLHVYMLISAKEKYKITRQTIMSANGLPEFISAAHIETFCRCYLTMREKQISVFTF